MNRSGRGSSLHREFAGQVKHAESTELSIDDVWRLFMLQPAYKVENVGYQPQKPLAIAERVIEASTDPGDPVADFFCGSVTARSLPPAHLLA